MTTESVHDRGRSEEYCLVQEEFTLELVDECRSHSCWLRPTG